MTVLDYFRKFIFDYKPYKEYWNYEDGCILLGCRQLYEATSDDIFFNFILNYVDPLINNDGTITNFEIGKNSIDSFNSGKILFMLYEKTCEKKYWNAIEFLMDNLKNQPRTKNGNYIHKEMYPDQVWLDGLYMAQPFYMEYETRFNRQENYDDIINQYRNVRRTMFDNKKKLYYHGYDEARIQQWADKETGLSANFWLRSIGWYLMSLVDVIDAMSAETYGHYQELSNIFREAIDGILLYQDKKTKLFFQLVDCSDFPGNYTETSGSCMVAYSILKACRLKVLSCEKYTQMGIDIINSIENNKLINKNNKVRLTDICCVAGLGPGESRNGSAEYYISEKIVDDDSKGVGAFMMAYAQKLELENGG